MLCERTDCPNLESRIRIEQDVTCSSDDFDTSDLLKRYARRKAEFNETLAKIWGDAVPSGASLVIEISDDRLSHTEMKEEGVNKKTREALRSKVPRMVPHFESLSDLLDWIATKRDCQDAAPEYKPPIGWHTIRVGGGFEIDPNTIRAWARLFEQYAANRHGKVIWKDVVHFDRETREVVATFCIAP